MARNRTAWSKNSKVRWCIIFVIVALFATVIGCIVVLGNTLFKSPSLPSPSDTKITLQQVSIIFRHGDRNILKSYPNNPHLDYVWPNGFGALTKKGMLQLYKLGQRLRGMYGFFMGDKYQTADVIVRSSYEERCIMSAITFLAAFYQPSTEDEFLPGFPWQPVPVHEIPKEMDKWVTAKAPCPRLESELEQAISNFSKTSNVSLSSKYKEWSITTGKEISTMLDAVYLADTLQIEMLHGLELPKWVTDSDYRLLKHLYADYLAIKTRSLLQKRLQGGPLLKEILENMVNRRNGTDKHKFYVYSGHDMTLVAIMRTMGIIEENFLPGYGASIIFEMHTVDGDRVHEVKISYLNNTDMTEPHIIKIPGCEEPCLLDNLFNIWEPVLPENWERECLI